MHTRKTSRDYALEVARRMPALRHFPPPGEPFDISKSQVINWLIAQAPVQQELFNFCKRHGAIVYDVETHRWRGADSPAMEEAVACRSEQDRR
jgi:hypothetical protein